MAFLFSICVAPMAIANTEEVAVEEIQPLTKAEIQQLLSEMRSAWSISKSEVVSRPLLTLPMGGMGKGT